MLYSNEITGKLIRETIKSLPTTNDTYMKTADYDFELRFKNLLSETAKGDFTLYVDGDRVYTRVVLNSQMSKWTDDWTQKEWRLDEMTSKDWRFIEDKIRRAKKRIASDAKCNRFLSNTSLNLYSVKHDGEKWNDNYVR